MSTIAENTFGINGVISTDKTVVQNMNTLATAAGCWMTYDVHDGKWSVIINRAGTSVAAFNDSNIVGSISISGTGLTELYNSVSIQYPHKDLQDQTDYIDLTIPSEQRYNNELDNRLNMEIDIINNPIQAEYIAGIELKQSRVDKVIQFRTDYSKLGLKAGDLIDITSEMYGYTNKMWRITKIEEDDSTGELLLSITALEYDASIYDTSTLSREARSKATGIPAKINNKTLVNNDNSSSLKMEVSSSAALQGLALTYAGATAAKWILDYRSPAVNIAATGVILTWGWDASGGGGTDLDIRCRIVSPDAGQYYLDDCLGYTGSGGPDPQFPSDSVRYWPQTGNPIIGWGGDNTGTGTETVLVDIGQFKAYFPGERYLILECRGNWYNEPSSDPAYLTAALYEGGSFSLSGYSFVNSGAVKKRSLDGINVYVDSNAGDSPDAYGYYGADTPGDLMGYFVFDTVNNAGQFWNTLPDDVPPMPEL